jgi:hypothetical protein
VQRVRQPERRVESQRVPDPHDGLIADDPGLVIAWRLEFPEGLFQLLRGESGLRHEDLAVVPEDGRRAGGLALTQREQREARARRQRLIVGVIEQDGEHAAVGATGTHPRRLGPARATTLAHSRMRSTRRSLSRRFITATVQLDVMTVGNISA